MVWSSLKRYITLPLVGYIILAFATAYAIGETRNNATQQRQDLAVKTALTQQAGCSRTNDLRVTVQGVLIAANASIDDQVNKGEITPSRGQASKDFYRIQIKKLEPINCQEVYPVPDAD